MINVMAEDAEMINAMAKDGEDGEDGNKATVFSERKKKVIIKPRFSKYFLWIVQECANIHRNDRRIKAVSFRADYAYDSNNTKETKTCIWPHGCGTWEEAYSGITWVGVHGKDSICVVTLAGDLDMTRVSGGASEWRKDDLMCDFRKSAVYELEVLPNPPSKTFKTWMKSIKKPYGVVCVRRDRDEGYDEQKAIEFLKEEFSKYAGQDTTPFGTDKTVLTALSCLQHVCNREFKKANEIEISWMNPKYIITAEGLTIKELPISRIKRYLVAINEPDFKGKEPNMEDVETWFIRKEMSGEGTCLL